MPYRLSPAEQTAHKLAEQRVRALTDPAAWDTERRARLGEILRQGRVISTTLAARNVQPNTKFGTASWERGKNRETIHAAGWMANGPAPTKPNQSAARTGVGVTSSGEVVTWAASQGYHGDTTSQRVVYGTPFVNADRPVSAIDNYMQYIDHSGAEHVAQPLAHIEKALAQLAVTHGITL